MAVFAPKRKTLPTTLDNRRYLHYMEPGIGITNAIAKRHQNALQSISVFYFIVLSTLKRNVFPFSWTLMSIVLSGYVFGI